MFINEIDKMKLWNYDLHKKLQTKVLVIYNFNWYNDIESSKHFFKDYSNSKYVLQAQKSIGSTKRFRTIE